ncbi:MAG: HlyD family secretion protein [Bacteroidales bacterium]
MDKRRKLFWVFILFFAAIVAAIFFGFFQLTDAPELIQGQVDATEVRLSGKLPGRIERFTVKEGDRVKKGDTLVWIDSPEVHAKLQQASAAEQAAQAQNMKAIKGARVEQIEGAFEMWQKAKAGLDIAEKSYRRIKSLYEKGVVTAQKHDEVEANLKAMIATEKAAKSQYDMAVNGAEREDKLAASALVERAKGAVAEVESYIKETHLLSPADGEVSEIFPKMGELVGTGAPILNVMLIDDLWVSFNVREDLLADLKQGTEFTAFVPALGNKEIRLKVTSLKSMGSYAAWKATKVSGQYDIKTFEVKAVPVEQVADLRPGMSVLLKR